MSERSFSVVLSARVDQYVAAMEKAKKATTNFSAQTSGNMKQVGQQMQQVGGWMSTRVTLPIVAAGTAAGKLAYDFETAFARMQGLANVPAAEIEGLKQSVLTLGRETAVAPQELADALYFAASAGLDSAQAMDAVTVAAKASAAGMGSTTDVVGLVSSAIASYGADVLNAAEATDILTATVRAGRADPQELAGSLGRILPIASQLGVGFEEVGGATAYLSNVFGDTGRTVTAMSGFFAKLVAPTRQGREALQQMGTSAEELQAVLKNDGLIAALELLREKGFADNQQALRALFDDIEGYQGALALLNDSNGTLAGTMGDVANSTGALGTAFDAVAGTNAFKIKQAFTDIKATLTEVGGALLPLVADIVGPAAHGFQVLVDGIMSLPAPLRTLTVGFIGALAAAGPLIMIGGSLVRNFESIKGGVELARQGLQALGLSASATTATMGALGIVAVAVGAALVVYDGMSAKQKEVAERAHAVASGLDEATDAAIANASATDSARVAHQLLAESLTSTGEDGKKLSAALGTLGLQTEDVIGIFSKLALVDVAAGGFDSQKFANRTAYLEDLILKSKEFAGVSEELAGGIASQIAQEDELGLVYQGLDSMGIKLTDSQKRLVAAMAELQDQAEKTDLDQTIRDFLATDAASSAVRMSLLAQAEAQSGLQRTGNDLLPLYESYIGLLAENKDAVLDTVAAEKIQTQALTGVADAQRRAVSSGDKLNQLMLFIGGSLASASSSADSFGEAIDRVLAPFADIEAAQRNWEAGVDNLTESIKQNGRTLDVTTEKGRANRSAISDQVDGIKQWMVALVQSGSSTEDAAAAGDMLRESLIGQLDQLGFTREEAEAYVTQLGLTPDSIRTAVELQKVEETKTRLQELLDQQTELDEGVKAEIQADIDTGQFDEAERRLKELQRLAALGASIKVAARYGATPAAAVGGGGFDGDPSTPFATGGFINGPVHGLLGEAGDEVVLPLTRPGRIRDLLTDPRVLPRVLAALGMRAFANGGIVGSVRSSGSSGNLGVDMGKLMAAKHEVGDISSGDYRAFLSTQLGGLEKYSDEWLSTWRQIRQLDDQAAQSSRDRLAEEDAIQAAMVETGATSAAAYENYLLRRLGSFQQYSADWMAVWRQLQDMQRQESTDQENLTRGAFDRAEAQRDLAEAERDFADATAEANEATGKAALYGLDKNRSADERRSANEEAARARARLADVAFSGASARAVASGLAKGTPEWARFVRGEIEAFKPTVSADVAAQLDRLLLGVPQFASGGYIPARPGGTLARLGEAGQGEYAVPEGKLTAMMATASGQAAAQVAALLAVQGNAARTEGGPLVAMGDVHVGSRHDLAATSDMFRAVAWRARLRSR